MNATDILVMPVASYFVNMYFLGCLQSTSTSGALYWNVYFAFLFVKIAYFCPFIKIELHYMNLFCIFAL